MEDGGATLQGLVEGSKETTENTDNKQEKEDRKTEKTEETKEPRDNVVRVTCGCSEQRTMTAQAPVVRVHQRAAAREEKYSSRKTRVQRGVGGRPSLTRRLKGEVQDEEV